MRSRAISSLVLLSLWAAGITPLGAQPTPEATIGEELLVGPVTFTQSVQGVPVSLSSRAYLSLQTTPEGLNLRARVVADLSDLQAKFGAIIDTIPLPRDNCRSFSANNPVATIWGKELKATESSATVWLHGYVDVWDCRENPIPNSKMEMQVREVNVGPLKTGVKISVPVLVTWPGDPIKNKIATQPFDLSEPLMFTRVTDSTVALELGSPNVQLGGQFVAITKGLLSIAGIDVNSKAREALREAIDPTKLQVSIPEEYLKLNPKIEKASFAAAGSNLTATMTLSARVPAEQVNEVISKLVTQLQNKKS